MIKMVSHAPFGTLKWNVYCVAVKVVTQDGN